MAIAVGCGFYPGLSKVSSMTREDYDEAVADADGEVQDVPPQSVDSDASVSLGSLTDSSVDTASESEKILLPALKPIEKDHLPVL